MAMSEAEPTSAVTAANTASLDAFARRNGAADHHALRRFPKFFEIETTSVCNAHCPMCYIGTLDREYPVMPDHVFDALVEQVAPHADWVGKMGMNLLGEPMMDPQLEDRIARLKELGIPQVAFATNASFMTPERTRSMLACGVDEISFSIDGVTAETFETVRAGLSFTECVGNVEAFIAARNAARSPIRIRIRMVIQNANAAEYDDFLAYWAARLGPGDTAYGKLLHRNSGKKLRREVPAIPDIGNLNDRACTAPWSTLVVLADGRAGFCIVDTKRRIDLGNILETPIEELWRSEAAETARETHRLVGREGIRVCHNCNPWDPAAKIEGIVIPEV